MRIYVTCDIGPAALDLLVRRGWEVEIHPGPEGPSRDVLVDRVSSGIDALITTLRDPIDETVLDAAQGSLKLIAQDAVGVDNIDRAAANRLKVPYTHTPDVLSDATAEFALFMLGGLARMLYSSERLVRSGGWTHWHPYKPFLGNEVSETTIGVVGAGRIGRAFLTKCLGLNVQLRIAEHRSLDLDFVRRLNAALESLAQLDLVDAAVKARVVPFEEVLEVADYVSLHVPLTGATRHLIDRRALARMKLSAGLVNTARGPVVDEIALVQALRDGTLGGAALDVFEVEPLPANSPLRDPTLADRLRLYHHFGSGGKRTRLSPDPDRGMAGRCVYSVIQVLEGHHGGDPLQIPFLANPEAFK